MIYNLLRAIVNLFFNIFFRITYTGHSNIPVSGPVIVASNHISFWDPPVIGCGISRPIHFMAKEELFTFPIFSWVITKLKAFPVKRGTADRGAIRTALSLLEQGEIIGLFPEGTRSKTGLLGKAEPGLALIAAKSGAVIIPAALVGTDKIFRGGGFFPKIEVKFGKPIIVEQGVTNKESLDKLTKQMMSEIAALIGGEYQHG